VTVHESGPAQFFSFFVAAAQVGGKTKGWCGMWMKINGQGRRPLQYTSTHQRPVFHTPPSWSARRGGVKRGDKITVMFSELEAGVGLVVKKPAGDRSCPSIILSGWRID